jgi:hypothetical protein
MTKQLFIRRSTAAFKECPLPFTSPIRINIPVKRLVEITQAKRKKNPVPLRMNVLPAPAKPLTPRQHHLPNSQLGRVQVRRIEAKTIPESKSTVEREEVVFLEVYFAPGRESKQA